MPIMFNTVLLAAEGQTCLYKLCSKVERLQILCDLLNYKDEHRELI